MIPPPAAEGSSRAGLKSPRRRVDRSAVAIDMDLLDEGLVDALDADLRLIRRGGPPPVAPPVPAPRAPEPPTALRVPKPAQRPKPLRPALPPARPGVPISAPAQQGDRIASLLRDGRLAEADRQIAAHAALAGESGDPQRRHDAASWAAMRALLAGDQAEARTGLAAARQWGAEAGDPDAPDRHWHLRFWIAMDWGDEADQDELLDHCRERAYRYDDLEWRAPLTLALARLGRNDEARRDFDVTLGALRRTGRIELMCLLAESAWLLGDAERAGRVQRHLEDSRDALVVLGKGWVCLGARARYQAHAAAALGAWARADEHFATAVEVHRDIQAQPLLARTLHEWGCSLVGRDDARARGHLEESRRLGHRLGLAGLGLAGLVPPRRDLPAA